MLSSHVICSVISVNTAALTFQQREFVTNKKKAIKERKKVTNLGKRLQFICKLHQITIIILLLRKKS